MFSILALGFLIGMQHALEADHVAAVASIASGERSVQRIVRHGVAWGAGHTLALLVIGGAVVTLGSVLPEHIAEALEFVVGIMLVLLGGWVLYRLARERIHFHMHRHSDGVGHLHAHSHAGEDGPHDPDHHDHTHPRGLPLRTLLIGIMHGLAGSAALLLLSAASFGSASLGLLYIAVFGFGSIVGMAALSAVIAIPLTYSARMLTWGHRALEATIGSATMALGGSIIYQVGVSVGSVPV